MTSSDMMNVALAATTKLYACDYLVVGAGAASIAFIDTLLTQRPSSRIVLVDKNPAPGGHWVHAYDFVKLHQPSLLYGVTSRQLEGNWLKLMLRKLTLPWHHRASKDELLKHYDTYIQDKVAAEQIEYFPNCQYQFSQTNNNRASGSETSKNLHYFSSLDGSRQYSVEVKTKLVNGILGECIVPSQNPVTFPVDPEISIVTPNQIFDGHRDKIWTASSSDKRGQKHFVVLGCGKTAMDTVVYLQRTMKVKPAQISWVIPNDVWILKREGSGGPWSWPQALLEHNQDKRKASLALEKKGVLVRIDPKIEPTKFRFPVVGMDELKYMRLVTNIIRRGRVTGITKEQRGRTGKVVVAFSKDHEAWTPNPEAADDNDLVFVHCTSPGPFNGNTVSDVFASEHQLNLNLLFAPPVPISMSVIAYIEFARINKTLDLAFGRRLEESLRGGNKSLVVEEHAPVVDESEDISENEVVRLLIKGIVLQSDDEEARGSFQSILNLALFLALADTDPMVGFQFLKENRLSFFSIPGFKGGVYESLGMMMERAQTLGFTDNERCMIELVREKLQVLEGK